MFFVGKNEAECKFWQTPELIEELLPNLDPESTLRLAQAHEMTRDILQGSINWNKLIKRNSPLKRGDKVGHFVGILKLLEDTKSNMLDLLDAICESNPPFYPLSVKMCCPRHPDAHPLTSEGFFLLEKVEAEFGTVEQTVEAIRLSSTDCSLMSSLASRLSRQEQKLTSVRFSRR